MLSIVPCAGLSYPSISIIDRYVRSVGSGQGLLVWDGIQVAVVTGGLGFM